MSATLISNAHGRLCVSWREIEKLENQKAELEMNEDEMIPVEYNHLHSLCLKKIKLEEESIKKDESIIYNAARDIAEEEDRL